MINPFLARVATPPIGQAAIWAESYDGRQGPLINLSQAVPGNPPPPEMMQRLSKAAGSTDAARYGAILGEEALRVAYAKHASRVYGATIMPAETAITSGCNQAFFVAMTTLARTGDAVILPAPFYFNHKMTLDMLGIDVRPLEMSAESGFLPDVAALERLIGSGVRALALVTPNNPTGAIYPAALLAEIYALCRRSQIRLVLDETYRDFLPPHLEPPHALFGAKGWEETLVGLYSFSKAYAIPGHRVGAMIAGSDFLAQAAKVLDCLHICPPRPPQPVLAWAIEALADWRMAMSAEIIARAELFRRTMTPLSGWRIEQMGAYFAYVRHPFTGRSSAEVAESLARRLGVVTLPGSFFGEGQDAYLRLAFANISSDRIEGLGERLRQADALFEAVTVQP